LRRLTCSPPCCLLGSSILGSYPRLGGSAGQLGGLRQLFQQRVFLGAVDLGQLHRRGPQGRRVRRRRRRGPFAGRRGGVDAGLLLGAQLVELAQRGQLRQIAQAEGLQELG